MIGFQKSIDELKKSDLSSAWCGKSGKSSPPVECESKKSQIYSAKFIAKRSNLFSTSRIRRGNEKSSWEDEKIDSRRRKNLLSLSEQRNLFGAIRPTVTRAAFSLFTPTILPESNQLNRKGGERKFSIWLKLSFVIGQAGNFSSLRRACLASVSLTERTAKEKCGKCPRKLRNSLAEREATADDEKSTSINDSPLFVIVER